MALQVHTARIGSNRADALDVTRASGVSAFAPSWALLAPTLRLRKAGRLDDEAWETYRAGYLQEMRESYRRNRVVWDALLAWPAVTLLCYCTDPQRCHRRILAEILAKLGAVDHGEAKAR